MAVINFHSNGSTLIEMLIDLSHTIENGLITYKGLPAPVICDFLSRSDSRKIYENGTSFQISKIEMVANTGTYIDCPYHRYEVGKDLSEIRLSDLYELAAIVIRVPFNETLAIGEAYLRSYEVRNKAVLFHTGWDRNWNTEKYFENHPYLTEEAALYLRDGGAKLVGIDSHNIDDTKQGSRPVHSILLGEGILIVEHLCNLENVPDREFRFSAVPPKLKAVGTFPVRALANCTLK